MVTLESSKLFGQLPGSDLQKLKAATKELRFRAGQQIFQEGDPGDGVYVVKSGVVEISGVINSDQRQVFSRIMPGDVFGEMAVLDDLPRSASATAEKDTEVYFVPRDEMIAMLKSSPGLSISLVQEVSRRLREFNRQYLQKVLQAERMALVGRFASSIVHDLKNPLTIISMATDAGCSPAEMSPEARRTARDRINRQVDRITSLVNDILEFTRGSQGTKAFTEVDYPVLLRQLIDEIQQEVIHKNVQIIFENELPTARVMANPKRLSRVFHNLIHNATDMLPKGGRIYIRVAATDHEVITDVRDTGPGIAPQIIDQIFEAFVTFGKQRGTGLGLSISQRIMEEHQGRLGARNHPEGGAVFSLTLPKARPNPSAGS